MKRVLQSTFLLASLGFALCAPGAEQAAVARGGGGGGHGGGGGGGFHGGGGFGGGGVEHGAGFGGNGEAGWGGSRMPSDWGGDAGFGGNGSGGWGGYNPGGGNGYVGGGGWGGEGYGDRGARPRFYTTTNALGASGYRGYIGARPETNPRPQVPEAERIAAANQTYNYGKNGSVNTLASDGGFGHMTGQINTQMNVAARAQTQTRPIQQAELTDHGAAVRNAFLQTNHPMLNDRDWYARHNNWWGYGLDNGWGNLYWDGVGWEGLAGLWGMSAMTEPVEYDYGNNITYQGDQVYYGTTPQASTVQYYTQAQTLATSAPVIPTAVVNGRTQITGDWKPLGVFSLGMQGQSTSTTIFQLAVNKNYVVSGNYYNSLNDQSSPIHGKVDKKTMRVAFTVGNNKTVVYDTGLANLLEAQSTILVHLSKDQTQQEILTRLEGPPKKN